MSFYLALLARTLFPAAFVAALLIGAARPGLARRFAFAASAALFAAAAWEAFSAAADRSFSATGVLNTEAILNAAGIAVGLGLVVLSGVALHAAARRTAATRVLLIAAFAILAVDWSADLVLAALQHEVLAVSAARVRYVALVQAAAPFTAYAFAAVGLILAWVACRNGEALAPETLGVSEAIARRIEAAAHLRARRRRNAAAFGLIALVCGLAYEDFYASRPPRLSTATPVAADGQGEIRIPVADVADGRLHRFAFVTSDGHRVRFFLINRFDAAHVRIGVVFDACMICGDKGYIQDGDEVICIACHVHLFRPSIGKPGGCNPIPLPHAADETTIAIAAADLEKGAKYFSEVVEIQVNDPVSGAALSNTRAPYQFEHRGRTYFFQSRDTYERFRADPKAFAVGEG